MLSYLLESEKAWGWRNIELHLGRAIGILKVDLLGLPAHLLQRTGCSGTNSIKRFSRHRNGFILLDQSRMQIGT